MVNSSCLLWGSPLIAVSDKYIKETFGFDYTCDYLININKDTNTTLFLAVNMNNAYYDRFYYNWVRYLSD